MVLDFGRRSDWPVSDFQLAPRHAGEVIFAELGKLLLMFFAGMEIDLAQFNRTHYRSIGFGLLHVRISLTSGLLVVWAG